jgi:hypothetical protein
MSQLATEILASVWKVAPQRDGFARAQPILRLLPEFQPGHSGLDASHRPGMTNSLRQLRGRLAAIE